MQMVHVTRMVVRKTCRQTPTASKSGGGWEGAERTAEVAVLLTHPSSQNLMLRVQKKSLRYRS